jgi:hypothetical protein
MFASSVRPDFVAVYIPPGAEVPSPVDARDAQVMIELKHDHVVKGNPPKLRDRESGEAVCSTFDGVLTSKSSRLTPYEQILDYSCFALSAQGPIRDHMFGLVPTWMRIQIMYADRGGCMISEERSFSHDFGILFAVLIGTYRSEAQSAGLQSAITPLSNSNGTPLALSDFDSSDREVQTGPMTNIGRPIQPFQVLVRLASTPAEHVAVYARGVNLMERPMAIPEQTARSSNSPPHPALRTRPSISRLAKSKGLEKNREIAISQAGETTAGRFGSLSRQFAPRSIFGSGTARYRCVSEAEPFRNAELTLQLSWQPKCRLSEASVLRLANDCGIAGVPTLIGSKDIADMDDSSIRLSLRQTFPGIQPVHKVLRAIVWQEDCVPLSSIDNVDDFLSACQSILRSM